MDDFLHNLRSGKLKQQQDRSGRSYGDQQYKGGQRRPYVDRRKKTSDNPEQLNALKDALDVVNETHKRIASAQEALAESEERKAKALEIIADNLHRLFNKDIAPRDLVEKPAAIAAPTSKTDSQDASESIPPKNEDATAKKLTERAKKSVFNLIHSMRDAGDGWEKIARAVAAKGYPTVSGKGQWRGVMVKNLYEKMLVL
jgi:hypothetical protein